MQYILAEDAAQIYSVLAYDMLKELREKQLQADQCIQTRREVIFIVPIMTVVILKRPVIIVLSLKNKEVGDHFKLVQG